MKTSVLTAALAFLAVTPAFAQYQGPGAVTPAAPAASGAATAAGVVTVEAVKAEAKDDAKVVLEGRLVRQLSAERYVFADETGEIEVEIDDDDFPQGVVNDQTRLRIEGEVDTHRARDTDIDADRVTLLN